MNRYYYEFSHPEKLLKTSHRNYIYLIKKIWEYKLRNMERCECKKTDKLCPKCGKNLYKEPVLLLTNPPQHKFRCLKCQYYETEFVK